MALGAAARAFLRGGSFVFGSLTGAAWEPALGGGGFGPASMGMLSTLWSKVSAMLAANWASQPIDIASSSWKRLAVKILVHSNWL